MENSADEETATNGRKTKMMVAALKEEMIRFTENTSLHGIKHVGDRKRSTAMRFLWLVALITMVAMLANTLRHLWQLYRSYPYRTATYTIPHASLPLPSIWLCLHHSLQRSKLRQLPHGDVIEKFLVPLEQGLEELLKNATVREILSNVTMQQVMDASSFLPPEVIKEARIGLSMLGMSTRLPVSRFVHRDFINDAGYPTRCFILDDTVSFGNVSSPTMSDMDELVVILQVSSHDLLPFHDIGGLYASIGYSTQLPSNMDQKVNMMPGSAVNIVLSKSQNRYLPAPYRSLHGQDCEDTKVSGYKSPLRIMRQYSFVNCMTEKAILAAVKVCNCTSMYIGDLQAPQCSLLQYNMCFLHAATDMIDVLKMECKRECEQHLFKATSTAVSPYPATNYKARKPDLFVDNRTESGDWLRVTVTYDNTLEVVTEHKPAITTDDICTTVGGQLGLFIGASILTIIEGCEHTLIMLWHSLKCLIQRNNRVG